MTKFKTLIVGLLLGATCFSLGYFNFSGESNRIAEFIGEADDEATTTNYLTGSLTKATATFFATRLIDAGLSPLKDSELSLTPVGIGINVSVGKMLSPVGELLDRFSDVLLTSISLLTVQAVAFILFKTIGMQLCGIFIALASLLYYFNQSGRCKFGDAFVKVAMLLLVCRIFLPISAVASQALSDQVLSDETTFSEDMSAQIDKYSQIDFTKDFPVFPDIDISWKLIVDFEAMKLVLAWLGDLVSWVFNLSFNALSTTTSVAKGAIVEMNNLVIESIVGWVLVFAFEMIIFPVVVFWLLVKLVNNFFDTEFNSILKVYSTGKPKKGKA